MPAGVPYFTLVDHVTGELAHFAFGRSGPLKNGPLGSGGYWSQFYQPNSAGWLYIPQQGYPNVGGTQYALVACRDLNLDPNPWCPIPQQNCFYGRPGSFKPFNTSEFSQPITDPSWGEWCIGWCYGATDYGPDLATYCASLFDQSLDAIVIETAGHASCPGFDSRFSSGVPGQLSVKNGLGWFCCGVVKFRQQLAAGGCANALAYIAANYV